MALVRHADTKAYTAQEVLILEAARSGDEGLVGRLLEEDITRVGARGVDKRTALHLAVINRHESVVGLLLRYGANTEAADSDEKKPLYIAVEQGHKTLVELLLRHGALVESLHSGSRHTALHRACEIGDVGIAKVLLDFGAAVDAQLANGYTPLALAASNGPLFELLLEHGANRKAVFDDGKTIEDLLKTEPVTKKALETPTLLEGPPIDDPGPKRDAEQGFTLVRSLPPPGPEEIDKFNACRGFELTMVAFFIGEREKRLQISTPVFDVLYGRGPEAILASNIEGSKVEGEKVDFTWYHIPANNLVWVEALLTRVFTEKDPSSEVFDDEFKSRIGLPAKDEKRVVSSTARPSFMRPACRTFKTVRITHKGKEKATFEDKTDIGGTPNPKAEPTGKPSDGYQEEETTKQSPTISPNEKKAEQLVSFMPYLHYETYDAYDKMAQVLNDVRRPRLGVNSKPPTPGGPSIIHPVSSPGRPRSGPIIVDVQPKRKARKKHRSEGMGWFSGKSKTRRHAGDDSDSSYTSRPDDVPSGRNHEDVTEEEQDGTRASAPKRFFNNVKRKLKMRFKHDDTASSSSEFESRTNTSDEEEGTSPAPAGDNETHGHSGIDASVIDRSGPKFGNPSEDIENDTSEKTMDNQNSPDNETSSPGPSKDKSEVENTGEGRSEGRVNITTDQAVSSSPSKKPEKSSKGYLGSLSKPSEPSSKKIQLANLNEHLIKGYIDSKDPAALHLQPRRTLDQYFYAHLENTTRRDRDQVVYRYINEKTKMNPKLFMVDQLWIWILNEDTVISCCPVRWHSWLGGTPHSEPPYQARHPRAHPQPEPVRVVHHGRPPPWVHNRVPGPPPPPGWRPPMGQPVPPPGRFHVPPPGAAQGYPPRGFFVPPPTVTPHQGYTNLRGGAGNTSSPSPVPVEASNNGPAVPSSQHADTTSKKKKKTKKKGRPVKEGKTQWPVFDPDIPLDIHQQVLRYLKGTSRSAVTSVFDLGKVITSSCASVFDPNRVSEEFQFFEFFERSIGIAADKEARYLLDFRKCLEYPSWTQPIEVWDITKETEVLVEIEDILDELFVLKRVLTDQKRTIEQMEASISKIKLVKGSPKRNVNTKPPSDDYRVLENHLTRVDEMQELAMKTHKSIHHLIDLKQKQANFSEALLARKQAEIAAENARQGAIQAENTAKQAEETARQGKTIMAFTVVTILFLPLSFMAAFFAINIEAFPFNDDGKLPLGYVLKYMLSIGFAASIPFIFVAFNVDKVSSWMKWVRQTVPTLNPGLPGNIDSNLNLKMKSLAPVIGLAIITVIIIPVIWTSSVASTIKVAVTISIVLLLVVVAAVGGLLYLAEHMREAEDTSISSGSIIDDGFDGY